MDTSTFAMTATTDEKTLYAPATTRGRALYTIDWFINGKPVLAEHDSSQINITQLYQS